jgi:hypothetical protein
MKPFALLMKGSLTPADCPYAAEYPRLLELADRLTTRLATAQSELAVPPDLHPTNATLKLLTRRTRQLAEAIGSIQHLLWAIKSSLKHRTVLRDGRLTVVPNASEAAKTLVRQIEAYCP